MARRRNRLLARLGAHPAVTWLLGRASRLSQGPVARILPLLTERMRRIGLVESVTRFVLTIGDEGATLVQLRGHTVVDAVFVAADAEDGWQTLRGYFLADSRANIIVSADVLEQMYREEQLPNVGRFDRGNVLKRRLDVAFPQDRLKAAMPVPAGGRAIFASLPQTETIGKWIEFLESLPNPIIGFCLMPFESSTIGHDLGPSTEGESRQVWRVLVSEQASSGFRQIFETGGRMVVTRLTQRPAGELAHDAIAQLIERELRSSISYVKRLGYSDQDRLDLVVLCDPDVCRAVQERDLPVSSLTAYTPYQAGMLLDLGQVAPEESGYSDVLHARWLAGKRRPLVTLPTAPFKEKLALDKAFRIGFAVAATLSLFAIADIASLALDALDTSTTSDLLDQQIDTERHAIGVVRGKLATFDVPLEDIVFVNKAADDIASRQVDAGALLGQVATALDPSMNVQRAWFRVPTLLGSDGPAAAPAPTGPLHIGPRGASARQGEVLYELTLVVRLTFNVAEPDANLQQAKDLHARLAKLFPDAEVETVHLPVNPLRSQVLEGSGGQVANAAAAGPPTAEYLIRKKI